MSLKTKISRKAIQTYHEKPHVAGLTEAEFEEALDKLAVYLRNKKNPCKDSTIKTRQGYLRTAYKKYGFDSPSTTLTG